MKNTKDLTYDELMLVKSIYRDTHLENPKILSTDKFTFPENSLVHYFKVSDVISNPSGKVGYLKNNKFSIISVLNYPTSGTEGLFNYEYKTDNKKLIRDASKEAKEFKWLQPGQNIRVSKNMALMYNYGMLNYKYNYKEQPMVKFLKYKNAILTLTNNLLVKNKVVFLVLDIPSSLPDSKLLNSLSNNFNNSSLENLPVTSYFNLLELWKFISPQHNSNSLLNILPPYDKSNKDPLLLPNRPNSLTKEYWDQINLLLVMDTKCILINLKTLMSYVDDYKIKSDFISTTKFNVFGDKFLNMLNLVSSHTAYTEEELISIYQREKDNKDIIPRVQTATVTNKREMNFKIEKNDDDVDDSDVNTDATGYELNSTLELESEYDNMTQLLNDISNNDVIEKQLEALKTSKVITNEKYKAMKKTLEDQNTKDSPYANMKGVKLKDILDTSKDSYDVTEDETTITENAVVFDKSYNKNTTKVLSKKYLENQYQKDIIRSIYAMQNGSVIVENYTINNISGIMGEMEEHVIDIKPLNGNSSTIKLVLPKVDPNGTIKMSGNTYVLRNQKVQKPIVKTDFNKVMLSTYYGKIDVYKAKTNYNNIGYWLMNTVTKLANNNDIKDLVLLSIKNPDVRLPIDYTHFSRFIKSFTFKNMKFLFDYKNRKSLLPKLDDNILEKMEDGVVLVGARGTTPIVMDFYNRLFTLENNKFKELDNLYELLNIDKTTSPIEFTTVKILKRDIPIVVLLSYYLGLTNLLKLLKVEFKLDTKKTKSYDKYNSYYVTFKDVNLLITRDHGKADLILSGLLNIEKTLKEINMKSLENKNSFEVLFTKLQLPMLYTNEIKLLEHMFVDPMSLSVLKAMKEPVNFKGLLVRASEMLVDDNYISSNNIDGMVIKGYERLAGLMYRELSTAIKDHNNKTFFTKSKITANPFSIVNKITEDSTTDLMDDLNPMASIKQKEDVSSLGAFGRSKDGMSKETRVMHNSEVGVISEATRDNSDVGITAYLTADPNIANTRGMINTERKEEWSNILSTSALLAPFGLTDDMKRLNFASIHNSHVIPIKEMKVPYVRTGYESIVPIKAGEKFAIVAEDDGKVTKVTKTSMEVEYKKLGKKSYKISNWSSKEESETCYTHTMAPNLKEGDKFIKDDTLIYNTSFFSPDVFNKNRVLYRQGDVVTVALVEDAETYEDSAGISKRLNTRLGTNVTKVKSFVIDAKDTVLNLVKVGDELTPTSTLFTITDTILSNRQLDPEILKTLENIKSKSPKAKVKGVVNKIVIMYNTELDDMSESIRNIVDESDKKLKLQTGYTGKVNSGYSIKGIPLNEGQVEIKIYINVNDNMGIGDKAIFGNQLKFTVGDIFESDIVAEDGTPIDATFSMRSIAARIVLSPIQLGTTSMLLEKLQEEVCKVYFGK